MQIVLSNAGMRLNVTVPDGAQLGHVRTLAQELEEVGAPSAFTLAVNAQGREDDYTLLTGDEITFRPKSGEKGRL